jgi:hypothetical protein
LAILLAPTVTFLEAGTNPATITVSATPSTWDQTQPLTIQVTVSGTAGTPTGSIKLYVDNQGFGNTIPLSGGTASISLSAGTPALQQPGQHTIGAAYSGDANYQFVAQNGSNAATVTVTTPTSVNLTARAYNLVVGQTVVFTATVSNGATGTVTLIDNGLQEIATVTVSGNQAVSAPLTFSQGNHSIVAQYNGDANFASASSPAVAITVGKANTTTTLLSPPNGGAANAGTGVTITAQVAVQAPGSASLSGSIQFQDTINGITTVLSTQSLSGGTASFFAPKLAAGGHTLTANYSGNGSLNASTGAVSFSVNGLPASVSTPTATGTPAPGQKLTISTTVTGPTGSVTPTGYVTFTIDGAMNQTQFALDATGKASMPGLTLGAGTHLIFANYLGDSTYASAGSTVFVLSICPNNPTVTVTSSIASPVYGQPLSFTGSVTFPGSATSPATGTMDFLADGQSMLTGPPLNLTNGQAQFGLASSSALPSGAHSVVATYYCGTGTTGISSNPLNLIINSAPSTTTLSLSGLQLNAFVLPAGSGFGTPTGSITFKSGNTVLGTAVPLDASSGIAQATFTATAAGTIFAHYSGDANFLASDSSPVTVTLSPTTMTMTSSENPAKLGDKVTFTATVANSAGGAIPTGSVAFTDGTTSLGDPVTLAAGQASISSSTLTAGAHTITAQYTPDSVFASATATIGQYVAPGGNGGGSGNGGSTIAAAASPQAAVYGQAVTLTATVTPTGTGNPPAPTGQVTFQNGSTVLGTAPVGQGLNLTSLAIGTYNVTASYSGDNVYTPSQATVSFVMGQASTQTVYAPKLNQSGQATLTATVTVVAPGAGTPTGTVQFQDASNNNLMVTSATLAGGTASAIVDASIATHQIVAIYNGDTNFASSTSASQLQLVSTAANITSSFAPDEAVSAYHVTNLTGDNTAPAFPLGTSLGGASIKITDSTGVSWLAPLYGVFASASQINFVIPNTVALGPALFTALLPNGNTLATVANITQTSPAIFTANMNGTGVAAGQFVHVAPGFVQTFDNIAVYDTTQKQYVPNPVSVGPDANQLYLILYGTGIRHRSSDAVVTATVNGVSVQIQTAAQGVYPGLDQMNLLLPHTLAGVGTVDVIVTVNGQTANTVQIALQ